MNINNKSFTAVLLFKIIDYFTFYFYNKVQTTVNAHLEIPMKNSIQFGISIINSTTINPI